MNTETRQTLELLLKDLNAAKEKAEYLEELSQDDDYRHFLLIEVTIRIQEIMNDIQSLFS